MRIQGMNMVRSFALAAAALLALSGCVERTLLIKSSPSGAEVTVNGRSAGTTPAVYPFRTYGVYELIASHPGCRRLRRKVPVQAPWYEWVPLDFVAENLWPGVIRDEHDILLELEPLASAEDAAIDRREAETLDLLDDKE